MPSTWLSIVSEISLSAVGSVDERNDWAPVSAEILNEACPGPL
jgi:hypothetical protein